MIDMSVFKSEHIIMIAGALAKEEEDTYINAIRNIADMLQKDNPKFDRTNFLHLTQKPSKPLSELGALFE